jgi:hypothetical protein
VNGIAVGTFFHWQFVTPFGIPTAGEFLLDPPPALDSNQYAKTYNEVKTVGSASANGMERPQDRADVVHFYAASTPTFVFNLAARQVVAQEGGHSLSENARAFALIYGGIHFRTDQDAGARLGRAVGTAVYKINLRPVHDDGLDDK